jgi:hypothetical protein
MGCARRQEDGSLCPNITTHRFRGEEFCCHHFDQIITEIFHLKDVVLRRRHIDIVEEYNLLTHKDSLIQGTHCDAEKKEEIQSARPHIVKDPKKDS